MKVVHLAPFVQDGYTGGMQRYVMELAREQRCAGLDASVYTVRLGEPHPPAPSPSTGRGSGTDVPVIGRRASFTWQRTPMHPLIVRDLRNIEADVLHLHSPSPTLEAALLLTGISVLPRRTRGVSSGGEDRQGWETSATGLRGHRGPGFLTNTEDVRSRGFPTSAAHGSAPKLVVTVHNDLPRTTRLQRALGAIEERFLARVLRHADAMIMPHEAFAADVAPRFGLVSTSSPVLPDPVNGEGVGGWGSSRVRIIPPGVDHTRFRDLGLERDPNTVLFVGHVRPEKGLHVLVEAMSLLPHRRLEVVAAVSYESKYYAMVKRRASSLLGDRVCFRENLTPNELTQAYNRAVVVVAPSLGLESWNLVLLEAAATGAACVRTDLPGMRWADFALEAPAGDPVALAQTIESAIARREELGCKGKQRAHEYSWDRTCRETIAAYVAA